jgi:hypothetical protein
MPIVLRKSGECWSVVGECYLHGVMGGEVVRQVEAGGLRLGVIALC